jgi:hypothetical protein
MYKQTSSLLFKPSSCSASQNSKQQVTSQYTASYICCFNAINSTTSSFHKQPQFSFRNHSTTELPRKKEPTLVFASLHSLYWFAGEEFNEWTGILNYIPTYTYTSSPVTYIYIYIYLYNFNMKSNLNFSFSLAIDCLRKTFIS